MFQTEKIELLNKAEFEDALEEDFEDAIKHGILVSRLVVLVCRELKVSEEDTQKIIMAAMLHDIGKLKLSKYLYGRIKGALDIEAVKYMRMHAQYSYDIVKAAGFDSEIQEIVYHHHENYDGSGYPDNLAGEEIPWGARILHICDAFGALLSKRPYREAFDVNTAMEMMIDEIKNFDMRAFLAFQRVVNSSEFAQIQELMEIANQPETSEGLRSIFINEFEEDTI